MASTLGSRFKGAVVGAVIGDCLGAPFEGMWNVEVKKVVDFFTFLPRPTQTQRESKNKTDVQNVKEDEDKLSARKPADIYDYDFTDDTAMARSVAYSLLSCSEVDPTDLSKRFVSEYNKEPNRGYGSSVGLVFSQLEKESYAEPFGPASRHFDGSGSYGNGGAMRIVPAALYAYNMNESQLCRTVDGITKVTHTHPDALNGAKLQCAAVHSALRLDRAAQIDVGAFTDRLLELMKKLEDDPTTSLNPPSPKRRAKRKSEESSKPYCTKLQLIKDYLNLDKGIDRLEIEKTLGNDISALGSVPAAIFSFLRATKPISDVPFDSPFERAVVYAVTLGGDTDTIATMAGAIAGAYYGIEGIPQHWQDLCEGVHDALTYGEKLCDLAQKLSSGTGGGEGIKETTEPAEKTGGNEEDTAENNDDSAEKK